MESLAARFDALQEDLMQIYEQGATTLDAQIKHWELIRQEQALYYVARKQGLGRLGLYPVPTSAVSENKAKQAIEMHLLLQNLQKSDFAGEKWTLVETSYEHFTAAPSRTLKKGPAQVTVIYDNKPENAMTYTVWKYVYFVDECDNWHKVPSHVDYYGVYYVDADGQPVYYVQFSTDAEQYSSSGQWTVQYANKTFSAPVTSSIGGQHGSEEEQAQGPLFTAGRETHASCRNRRRPRRLTPQTHSSRSRSRSRSPSTSSDVESRPPRGHRGGIRRGDSTGDQLDSEEELGGHLARPSGQVGSRTRQTASPTSGQHRHHTPRLVQLLKDANDPPVLLLRGPANTLKGLRRKSRLKYAHLYTCMSTAFSWVSGTCTERLGANQRMLIAFKSDSQRTSFLNTVPLPRSVTFVKGAFDAL
ncbi:E2 early protein [Bos taurus papillomavirus 41]|nr:E2 early protein [Bos taurus papillomavirus 41]